MERKKTALISVLLGVVAVNCFGHGIIARQLEIHVIWENLASSFKELFLFVFGRSNFS